MGDYRIMSQGEAWQLLGDAITTQLGELTAVAFATFEGVAQPSPEKTRWYMARPGMDRALSGVAMADGRLVSNVYITCLSMTVGSELVPVAVVDTVVTHPDHRRQGLAKRLLTRALDGLRQSEVQAVLLYTNPGSMPHHFYAALGFVPHRGSLVWERVAEPLLDGGSMKRCPAKDEEARALINRYNAGRPGYVPLDESLWAWRKLQRPAHMPAQVTAVCQGERLTGTATFCQSSLVTQGGRKACHYITDLGLATDQPRQTLAALLEVAPSSERWVTLSAEDDDKLNGALAELGFAAQPGEASMVLPLGEGVLSALQQATLPWYVLVESLVGV